MKTEPTDDLRMMATEVMRAWWRTQGETPTGPGWYEILRADGSRCVRAFGGGSWWIPLKDGWLSGLPAGFSWRGPIAPMGDDAHRSPLDECEEVARSLGVTA